MKDQASQPLTQYGLMAKRHWQEFCPRMYRQLEMAGALEEALFEAQETTLDEMETLTRPMEREQKLTPGQAQTAAWELIRAKYILLPPENPNGEMLEIIESRQRIDSAQAR